MTKDMSPEEYAREMLCSFDAPIEGAYFADLMNQTQADNRITGVPHDPSQPVFTWWDLGIDDFMPVWFAQRAGRELHIIDHIELQGKGIPEALQYVYGTHSDPGHSHRQKYLFGAHVPPHDIKARELGTGKSRFEIMSTLIPEAHPIIVAPMLGVEDGIAAVRSILPMCYFDKEKTEQGVSALRNYHRSKGGKPKHNWASHSSDAFRTGAVSLNQTIGYLSSNNVAAFSGRLRRRIRGMT